jgi:hypothetical protein
MNPRIPDHAHSVRGVVLRSGLRLGSGRVLSPAADPLAGALLLALLGAEHDQGAGKDRGDPLQDPEPLLGLGDIIRRGGGGDGAAFGLDVRGPAELRAEQSAVGSGAQRGEGQRGLDGGVRADAGLAADTVAVCQQQAATAEQVRADGRRGGRWCWQSRGDGKRLNDA